MQTPVGSTSSEPLFSPYAIGLFLLQPPVSFSVPEALFPLGSLGFRAFGLLVQSPLIVLWL